MINVDSKKLYKAVKELKCPNNSSLPVVNHVLVSVNEDELTLTSVDLDFKASSESIAYGSNRETWSVCVPGKAFRDYLKVLENDRISLEYIPAHYAKIGETDLTFSIELQEGYHTLKVSTTSSKAEFKCLDAAEFPDQGAKVKQDKWILGARSKDASRPVWQRDYGNIATDGFYLVYDPELKENFDPDDIYNQDPSNIRELLHDTLRKARRSFWCTITVDNKELQAALKQAKKAKANARLSCNGKLDITCKDDNETEYHTTVEGPAYYHHGKDTEFIIDTRLLLHSIGGMAEVVMLSLSTAVNPVYITDGIRESVIMPMKDN